MNGGPRTRADLEDYRAEVRAWLADHVARVEDGGVEAAWNRDRTVCPATRLSSKSFSTAATPVSPSPSDYGGQGLTQDHERVFIEEAAGYDLLHRVFGVSINIIGATLVEFGNHEQKLTHIRNILAGRERWLQFLSEPSGGSDLGRPADQRGSGRGVIHRQRPEDVEQRAPTSPTSRFVRSAPAGTFRNTKGYRS